MRITVRVTQEMINRGLGSSRHCPIAQALNRACAVVGLLSPGQDILVGHDGRVYAVSDRGPRPAVVIENLPPSAVEFIHAFDRGKPVSPFEFDVDARRMGLR